MKFRELEFEENCVNNDINVNIILQDNKRIMRICDIRFNGFDDCFSITWYINGIANYLSSSGFYGKTALVQCKKDIQNAYKRYCDIHESIHYMIVEKE